MFNFAETLGAEDDRERAVRQLNRSLKFRQALSHAVDRKALGQSLVRVPFTQEYAGGLYPEGPLGDADSVVYYGYQPDLARQLLDDLGLRDTDGDGIRNWTEKDFIVPLQQPDSIAPLHSKAPRWHRGSDDHPQHLLPFEEQLRDLISAALSEPDPARKAELMSSFNRVFTDNVYMLGLTTAPGALVVNKRIRNVPPGMPIVAYQWAEDAIMRERLWLDDTVAVPELRPHTLPGL
jgi:ABC-type transport system substrate-binding protein